MRACVVILCLLGGFVLNTRAGPAGLPKIEVKEITVRIDDNSTLVYPDSLVLVPADFPDEHRHTLFYQLSRDVTHLQLTAEDNNDDVNDAVETVLRAAELMLKADNNAVSDVSKNAKMEMGSTHVYVVNSDEPNRRSRKRRSVGLVRRVRSPYNKQWQDLCDTCPSLAPQQPVVINIIKTGSGCGNDCSPPQNTLTSCGQPQCGPNFQHHPFMFHPPPHPPPHFHHYPPPHPPPHFHHYPPPPPMFHPQPVYYAPSPPAQPVNITPKPVYQQPQQPARPQAALSANKCDPCAAPAAQGPAPNYGGSFSQSSASAQSSSFAWNG